MATIKLKNEEVAAWLVESSKTPEGKTEIRKLSQSSTSGQIEKISTNGQEVFDTNSGFSVDVFIKGAGWLPQGEWPANEKSKAEKYFAELDRHQYPQARIWDYSQDKAIA